MKLEFPVKETVTKRYSVRTYEECGIEAEKKEKLLHYAKSLQNPLGPKANFKFIEKETFSNGEKLGTYGVIAGAKLYVGVTIPNEEGALEALGYDFEKLVLYATNLGLGTCWLGGTFNKSAFAEVMNVKENELFPIVSPVGYPAEKQRMMEKVMRYSIKADKRLAWEKIFYEGDFSKSLTKDMAKEYAFPLEMLRLAPSAVNKQPWRVVYKNNSFHFFEQHSVKSEGIGMVDMQRIDVGIAICHFHLAVLEMGLSGRFEKQNVSDINLPSNMEYVISWRND